MTGLLVTEWIEPIGGAERVLDRFAALFPDAELLCLWNDAPARFAGRAIHESWMARTPLRRHKALALPMMPVTWRARRGDETWALVSSYAFAHHVRVAPGAPKFVYAHSPARYLWASDLDGRGRTVAARIGSPPLRAIDRRAAREATAIAANSAFVAERIERAWGRDAEVIHPPVEVARIREGLWRSQLTEVEASVMKSLPAAFVVGLSRFIPYKRMDLVIRAGELLGLPVVLIGSGPEENALRARAAEASVPVQFLISPSDAVVYSVLERASLLVFPPVEDFGIVPVEAMAFGTPVIANRRGGAAESVVDGVSGSLFDPRSDAELLGAAHTAMGLGAEAVRARADHFDAAVFDRSLLKWLAQHDAPISD